MKRLTILAFIFILTACVCGIFGMNIAGSDGNTIPFPLWQFSLTLGLVLPFTVMLAFTSAFTALLKVLVHHCKAFLVASRAESDLRRQPVLLRILLYMV